MALDDGSAARRRDFSVEEGGADGKRVVDE